MNRVGASLLALGVAAHVVLGPWAARWPLAAGWLGGAALVGHFWRRRRGAAHRPRERAALALAIGFAGLGAATAARAYGWSPSALLALLYGIAATGSVTAFVAERSR